MDRKAEPLKESPSQTAGPFLHIGCMPNMCGIAGVYPEDPGATLFDGTPRGERITVSGAVYDGTGAVLTDAMIEIWQADADGIYPFSDPHGPADPSFLGWGRQAADPATGDWRFETVKPGRVPFPGGGLQAPHITVWIAARGINIGLHTRMYFPDEDNAADPLLTRIEHQHRVPTLIASKTGEAAYRFDIRLQGDTETIFFDI